MKKYEAVPFTRHFEADKADLVRLHAALGQVLDGEHGADLPLDVIQLRKGIEAAIRTAAIRLVYRIDRIRDSTGFAAYVAHARTIRTTLKHVATQMTPDSTDRFVVLLLEHHLETLLHRQAPSYPKILPHKNAA